MNSQKLNAKNEAGNPFDREDLLYIVRQLVKRVPELRMMDAKKAERRAWGLRDALGTRGVRRGAAALGLKNEFTWLRADLRAVGELYHRDAVVDRRVGRIGKAFAVTQHAEMRPLVPLIARYACSGELARDGLSLVGPRVVRPLRFRWVWRVNLFDPRYLRENTRIPVSDPHERAMRFLNNDWLWNAICDKEDIARILRFYCVQPDDLLMKSKATGETYLREAFLTLTESVNRYDMAHEASRNIRRLLDFVGPEVLREQIPEFVAPLCAIDGERMSVLFTTRLNLTNLELQKIIWQAVDLGDYEDYYLSNLCKMLRYFPP